LKDPIRECYGSGMLHLYAMIVASTKVKVNSSSQRAYDKDG
jgi:hypothetical protein